MTRFTPDGLQAYTAITAIHSKHTFPAASEIHAVDYVSWGLSRRVRPIKLYRGDISIADAPNHTPIREIA